MDDTEERKMRFEWLRSEQDLANDRISSYSEADQKIIAIITTIVVGLLSLMTSKGGAYESTSMSYILFLSSGLMSLAVIQSSVYCALALFFMERKTKIAQQIAILLNCDEDYAHSRYSMTNSLSFKSYKISAIPYYIFKSIGGIPFSIAGLCHSHAEFDSPLFVIAFLTAISFSITSTLIIIIQLREIINFYDKLDNANEQK